MGFKPTLSLTEQIADHLGSEIIQGRLAPSQRIQELTIARNLGVSRGSVREALLLLEGRNLIEIIPRRGAVVSDLSVDQFENLSRLSADLLGKLFAKVTSKLQQKSLDGQLAPLDTAVKDMERGARQHDLKQLLRGRLDLVEAAFPIAQDHYLESAIRALMPAALRLSHLVHRQDSDHMSDVTRSARALLDAIRRGDAASIGDLFEAHSKRECQAAMAAVVH